MPVRPAPESDGRPEQAGKSEKGHRIGDQEMLRLEEERRARRLHGGDCHQWSKDQQAEGPEHRKQSQFAVRRDIAACGQPGLRERDRNPSHEGDGVNVNNQRRAEA